MSLPAPDVSLGAAGHSIQEALGCALSLAEGGDIDEAAEVLRCECAQAPVEELSSTYQALLEACLRLQRADAAFRLLMEVQQRSPSRCVVPAAVQEAVLTALLQAQQVTNACELIFAMCSAGAVPSDTIFNSVLDGAVRSRAYSQAWDVLEVLLKHQRHADKYFVSILTKNLETSSDRRFVRRALGLVDRFVEQQRGDVDEIVFNSLLNVLGQIGDMQRLQQTLSKMSAYNVAPSAVTYGTVVKAYGRAHDIDAVLKVWQEMRNRNLGVNPVTCGCVLDACVKCGHIDKAMAIFQEMRLHGLHRNTVLYATLIKGLAKVRNLAGAIHLYQEMRLETVPCNLVTFNSLMDVCVRCGDLQTAALFLQDMMQMGIQPDLITFSTLIKGYSHIGEVQKALALSRELKSRGLKCDEIMFNSLIDACAKARQLPEGLEVFKEMLNSRVAPSNITFSILVKLHFEVGRAPEAFRLVEEMAPKYHCTPSRIVYTVLFRCCGQYGGVALTRAASLLTELASKRNSKLPDQGMVSAVLSGCVQHSQFDVAARVVMDFSVNATRRNGFNLPQDVLKSLFEALGAKDEARGQELLDNLKRKSFQSLSISQLEAAFAEGRRSVGVSSVGALHCGPAPTNQVLLPNQSCAPPAAAFEPYGQWAQLCPYPQQLSGVTAYPPHNLPYQQLQQGYYGGYLPMQYSHCSAPGTAPQVQSAMFSTPAPALPPTVAVPGPAPHAPAPVLADPALAPPPALPPGAASGAPPEAPPAALAAPPPPALAAPAALAEAPPAAPPAAAVAAPTSAPGKAKPARKKRAPIVDKENVLPETNVQQASVDKKGGMKQHSVPRSAAMNQRHVI
mmetsp:Transcript_13731/g.26097  ORF Transcript_13731/g.26097 Transcript_13731/m.26097 type:complete len:844 (-) Transcript_13731:100-2631(-)